MVAVPEYGLKRRMLSRSFHYQLKQSVRTTLLGPPENTREHVVAASRAMLGGDWRRAVELVINDKMNAKVTIMEVSICYWCFVVRCGICSDARIKYARWCNDM